MRDRAREVLHAKTGNLEDYKGLIQTHFNQHKAYYQEIHNNDPNARELRELRDIIKRAGIVEKLGIGESITTENFKQQNKLSSSETRKEQARYEVKKNTVSPTIKETDQANRHHQEKRSTKNGSTSVENSPNESHQKITDKISSKTFQDDKKAKDQETYLIIKNRIKSKKNLHKLKIIGHILKYYNTVENPGSTKKSNIVSTATVMNIKPSKSKLIR